jgi:hypothetical protein
MCLGLPATVHPVSAPTPITPTPRSPLSTAVPPPGLTPLDVHVVGTDPWVVAQTLASVAALVIGLIAIWLAVRQGTKARRDLLQERREAHRLDVLRSLAELWGTRGGAIADDPRLRGMLLALPIGWFPLVRAWTGVEPSEHGKADLRRLVERRVTELAATGYSEGRAFRNDTTRWPEAFTSGVTSELRRRIAEAANELDQLGRSRREWGGWRRASL